MEAEVEGNILMLRFKSFLRMLNWIEDNTPVQLSIRLYENVWQVSLPMNAELRKDFEDEIEKSLAKQKDTEDNPPPKKA